MWWSEDEYVHDALVPEEFLGHTGPEGIAVVRAYPDGKTDTGWGMTRNRTGNFMDNYAKHRFTLGGFVPGFNQGRWALAYVMRSLRMICIDVDGKNGGLQHVGRLGMLPPTLAETSRSGNGYHLFYATSEDRWGEQGFAQFKDRIGIQQGVDIRATGCVFHHKTQRWNDRELAELPQHLKDLLTQHSQQVGAVASQIQKVLDTLDPDEILTMQDALVDDLSKPIPAGRRNNTLFAVGSQLMLADVPDWEQRVEDRAVQVGLGPDEIKKLISNISKYGANA